MFPSELGQGRGKWNRWLLKFFSCSVQRFSFVPTLNCQQMKSGIWNFHCLSCFAIFSLITASLQRLTYFPLMIYLSENLGVFWNLKSAFSCDDYWIIAYSLVEFPFLEYARLYSLYFFGRRTQRQWSIFFPLLWPSLNNDSLRLWGFASYSHSGATFYPCSSYLS